MKKFFVSENQVKNDKVFIVGTDVNHIKNVLRMNIEDRINICIAEENYIAEILEFKDNQIECKIVEKMDVSHESNVNISIFQGLPKFDKMEFIIEKNTEIGVKEFIPVIMKRSIVKVDEKVKEKKEERFRKIAEVASKQSQRDIIPKVKNIIKFKEIIELFKIYDYVLVAYEDEKKNHIKDVLKSIKQEEKEVYNIGIVIGPEGGIDQEEIEYMKDINNIYFVSLGDRILRTETAGMVASTQILYELER